MKLPKKQAQMYEIIDENQPMTVYALNQILRPLTATGEKQRSGGFPGNLVCLFQKKAVEMVAHHQVFIDGIEVSAEVAGKAMEAFWAALPEGTRVDPGEVPVKRRSRSLLMTAERVQELVRLGAIEETSFFGFMVKYGFSLYPCPICRGYEALDMDSDHCHLNCLGEEP